MVEIVITFLILVIIIVAIAAIFVVRHTTKIEERLRREFEQSAAETMSRTSTTLREDSARQLTALLTPLKMRIEDFNMAAIDSAKETAAARRSLSDQIERLSKLNVTVSEETRKLSSALHGDNRAQGAWGENMLLRIFESAGLRKGINFDIQVTRDSNGEALRNADGSLIRPDMVVFLPGNRKIIVDSKTSLTAYLDWSGETDKQRAEEALKRHAVSVRRHIDELSSKEYHKAMGGSLEQVLMFIPNDSALIMAIEADRSILEYAASKNISLVSPSQILAVVHLIAQMWRKEDQDRNAAEIARIGGLIYDSVAGFVTELRKVETSINAAQKAYNTAFSKLTSGGQSILSRAQRLSEMGVKASKKIDPSLLDTFGDEA